MIDCAKQSWTRRVVFVAGLAAGCPLAALATNTVTGVIHNQTHGRFAAEAEVILFRLDQTGPNQSMREESRTKTDAQGAFTLDVRSPDELHLVRVAYQDVNYDKQVSATDAVSIDVFDAVSKVQDITGSIEIIRIGTAGNHLHVSDMVEIRNDSSPPRTQAGERTFEAYLPAHANIDSVLAAGPGTIAVLIEATPVPGEPGHYVVNFPLRPGATRFAFNYDLPYDGSAAFLPKNVYPLQQLAVMIPPTMKFTSRSAAFRVLRTGNDRYQVEVANALKAKEGPRFEISGIGALPALRAQSQSPPNPPVAAQPVPAFSTPSVSRAPTQGANGLETLAASGFFARSSRWQWWALGVNAVMLGICGFLLRRMQRASGNPVTMAVQQTKQRVEMAASLVEILKAELRQLEIDRSLGTVTVEDYASARRALEGTVKRALARAGPG
jgi:hypothetical protein